MDKNNVLFVLIQSIKNKKYVLAKRFYLCDIHVGDHSDHRFESHFGIQIVPFETENVISYNLFVSFLKMIKDYLK